MLNRILSIIAICFLLSCYTQDESDTTSAGFMITSPRFGWTYYDDNAVLLSANINSNNIRWYSSIDGYIGEGNSIQRWINSGTHRIDAEYNGEMHSVTINVNQKILNKYDEISILLNYSPVRRKFSTGEYFPSLLAMNGSASGFSLYAETGNTVSDKTNHTKQSFKIEGLSPIRDFRPEQHIKTVNNQLAVSAKTKGITKTYNTGEIRSFRVINTQYQLETPHNIEAELYYVSDNITLWKPVGIVLDESVIMNCINKIEALIIPRTHAIWGYQADVDADGRVAILLSQTINEEGRALGFFNQADFFKYNNDISSDAYNPASNEMDILYAAIPVSETDSAYSAESIIVTIGHELTHAANFTNKTWTRIAAGGSVVPYEELFLDEGLAHLSENLTGCGISGGNILFFNLFLNDTASYSFCDVNVIGQSDSAGMRGAMTLFMSWLFWKKGGMSWDTDNSALVTDAGGIEFLQKLVRSESVGWDSIGNAYGKPTDVLFMEMLYEMNCCRIDPQPYNYIIDKYTGEPVEFFLNMGEIVLPGKTININLPKIYDYSAENNLKVLRWSFLFLEPIMLQDLTYIEFSTGINSGKVFINSVVK